MEKIKIWLIAGAVALIVLSLFAYKCQSPVPQAELIGRDQNGNGVWDDVEEKIIQRFGYSNNTKNMMFQFARALQKSVSEPNMTKKRALEIDTEAFRAMECMVQVEPTFASENLLVEEWIVNSKHRTKNYNHYNALLSGETTNKGPDTEMCDFKVEK